MNFYNNEFIFYIRLNLPKKAFASETDKHHLISAVCSLKKDFGLHIYGLVILDDALLSIAGFRTAGIHEIHACLYSLLMRYREGVSIYPGDENVYTIQTARRAAICRLENDRDVIDALRYIHLIPLSEGYVESAFEYWWSSFANYRNQYYRDVIDSETILGRLSTDGSRARQSFIAYHRKKEREGNPVPECLREYTA